MLVGATLGVFGHVDGIIGRSQAEITRVADGGAH
jgi:hypothetical protein